MTASLYLPHIAYKFYYHPYFCMVRMILKSQSSQCFGVHLKAVPSAANLPMFRLFLYRS